MNTLGTPESSAAPIADEGLPPLRPGQLSPGWKTVFIAGWIGVISGFAAVWQACRVAGIAPWWLGPETNPRSIFITAIPFVVPMLVIAVAAFNLRITCWVGIAGGLACSAVALGDLEWPGLAIVEAVLGLAGVVISCACLGGRMRAAAVTPLEGPGSESSR